MLYANVKERTVLRALFHAAVVWVLSSGPCSGQERFYFSLTPANSIVEFDVPSCTIVSEVFCERPYNGLARTPDDVLYGAYVHSVYRLDRATCTSTLITNLEQLSVQGYIWALVARDSSSLLFMVSQDRNLFSVDLVSGEMDTVGYIGYMPAGDLTWYDDDLYLTAAGSRLVRIVMNDNRDEVVAVEVVGGGSAPGLQGVFGIVTVGADQCDSRCLLGFRGTGDAWLYSPGDATGELYCSGVLSSPNAAADATSTGEFPGSAVVPVDTLGQDTPGMLEPAEIANVLTPNGDGINDQFIPDLKGHKVTEARIYNRWGQVVHTSHFRTVIWDGHSSAGMECSDGVYYYVIELSGNTSGPTTLTGYLSLLR